MVFCVVFCMFLVGFMCVFIVFLVGFLMRCMMD